MPPTYYRGCWHVVSRGFLLRYRHNRCIPSSALSSLATELYDPKTFLTHAALLGQTFVHCRRFPTAASRRSLGRVSVPVWPITLSGRLRIVALVSRYLTNELMRRRPICKRRHSAFHDPPRRENRLSGISSRFRKLSQSYRQVAYVLLTRPPLAPSRR